MRPIVALIILVSSLACGTPAAPQPPDEHAILLSCAPSREDIPGARQYRAARVRDTDYGFSITMSAVRGDGELLLIGFGVFTSLDRAGTRYAQGRLTPEGPQPTGVPSRRTIGQQVRSSRPGADGAYRGAFGVTALDGRCIVYARVLSQGIRRVEGRPFMPEMTKADQRQIEDLVILMLSRLAKHGYTTVTKPAQMKKPGNR